eukprot:356133-Chlamydomonas_euryale.AAC.34
MVMGLPEPSTFCRPSSTDRKSGSASRSRPCACNARPRRAESARLSTWSAPRLDWRCNSTVRSRLDASSYFSWACSTAGAVQGVEVRKGGGRRVCTGWTLLLFTLWALCVTSMTCASLVRGCLHAG